MKIIVKNKADYQRACRELYRYYCRYIKDGKPARPVKVEIKRALPQRTLQQNRYYWGVVVKMIADYTGHDPDEVHTHLKYKFLRQTDGVIEWVRSTTTLDTAEFTDYIERCRKWALDELNIVIPSPDDITDFGDEVMPKKDIPF